jgi:hypothetical protein
VQALNLKHMKRLKSFQPFVRSRLALAAGICNKLVLVMACLVVATGLFLPIIEGGFHHRVPPGQFGADLRTMAAEMHYVFMSEADPQRPAAGSNDDLLAYGTGDTDDLAGTLSLTTTNTLFDASQAATNVPAQS